jgi:hypothetical protein
MAEKKWLDISSYGFRLGLEEKNPVISIIPDTDKSTVDADEFITLLKEIVTLTETQDERVAFNLSYQDMVKLPKLLVYSKIILMSDAEINKKYTPERVEKESEQKLDSKPAIKKKATVKHSDAGKKIGGARKDLYSAKYIGDLAEEIRSLSNSNDPSNLTSDELSKLTTLEKLNIKNNIWPKPDWKALKEEGLEPVVAGFIKLVRDDLSPKPATKSWNNKETLLNAHKLYPLLVAAIRDKVLGLRTEKDLEKLLSEARGKKSEFWLNDKIEIKDSAKVGGGFSFFVIQSKRRGFATFANAPAHYIEIKKSDAWRKSRVYNFEEHKFMDNSWDFVLPTRRRTESAKRKENEPAMPAPHLKHIKRTGPDYRNGKDVTGEDLLEQFGFSGIEYGNWVSNKERQEVLNHAYDSLKDLSFVTGLPPKMMGLEGRLSLAFGSRGRSKASAHYETGYKAINLTKMKGAGSFSHEWAHAYDHFLEDKRQSTIGSKFMSDAPGARSLDPTQALTKEMIEAAATLSVNNERSTIASPYNYALGAIQTVMARISKTPKSAEEAISEAKATVDTYVNHAHNWITHAYNRTAYDDKMGNEQFNHAVKTIVRKTVTDAGFGAFLDYGDILKPLMDEGIIPDMTKRGGQLKKTGKAQVRLAAQRIQGALRRIDLIQSGSETSIGWMSTHYKQNALKLDGAKKKKYWASDIELFARAFESWVIDKLEESDRENNYLSGHGVEGVYSDPEKYKGDPYPHGDERQYINEAMDQFMADSVLCHQYEELKRIKAELADNADYEANTMVAAKT